MARKELSAYAPDRWIRELNRRYALGKAEERLSAEFAALKQERKRVFKDEIKRMIS